MSCFLFVLVFDSPLRYLSRHGVVFSAYVDDISSSAPRAASQTHASLVRLALSLIGCQLNITKSELLSMSGSPPPLAVLPEYLHPPAALRVHPDTIWLPIYADVPPRADEVPPPITRTACLMHLGHPLPARLHIRYAITVPTSELKSSTKQVTLPPHTCPRSGLTGQQHGPSCLLYRTECLPLTAERTTQLGVILERFVFGVIGLPMVVEKKTLYTHRSRGLSMGYFPVPHPMRVLDLLHRNQFLHAFSLHPGCSMTPYSMFCSTLSVMGPPSTSTVPPVFISWEASKLQCKATAVMSVAGLVVFVVPSKLRPECTYTDGSKLGVPPASGAVAIMPGGHIAVCRVRGIPNSYKAELVRMLLGSHISGEGEKIHLDCQGAIASALSQKHPIRQAGWVQKVRRSLSAKGNSQSGLKGTWAMNSTSPLISMRVLALPPPPPARRSSPWDIVRHGESTVPPHKVWTHDLCPSHTHQDLHPLSWRPLKFRRLAWHKWLFSLQSRSGYAHYATYWSDKPPPHTCSHRLRFDNLSVHRHLAHCAESHPGVQALLSAWSPHAGAALGAVWPIAAICASLVAWLFRAACIATWLGRWGASVRPANKKGHTSTGCWTLSLLLWPQRSHPSQSAPMCLCRPTGTHLPPYCNCPHVCHMHAVMPDIYFLTVTLRPVAGSALGCSYSRRECH